MRFHRKTSLHRSRYEAYEDLPVMCNTYEQERLTKWHSTADRDDKSACPPIEKHPLARGVLDPRLDSQSPAQTQAYISCQNQRLRTKRWTDRSQIADR